MTGLLVGAYLFGTAVGVAVTVAAITWLADRINEATTLPAPRPGAVVIDMAGRRSTASWSA